MIKGIKFLKKLSKGVALGGAAGYLGARASSSSHEAPDNSKMGGKIGALVGASTVVAPKIGKVVFRKIKGRIIPIRSK